MEGARANNNNNKSCCCGGGVHVVSRRMVRPFSPPPPPLSTANGNTNNNGFHHHLPPPPPPMANDNGNTNNGCIHHHHHHHQPKEEEEEEELAAADNDDEVEVIHLTPWDLRLLSIDYIQKGILLPKPPMPSSSDDLVNALRSSFARALRIFYPFAGRLVADEHADDGTVSVSLRCTGEGAEFVHAAAPAISAADIAGSLYTPPVVWDLFPLAQVLGADAAIDGRNLPVLAVQVTVLGDGAVFVAMSLNHTVADGTSFWHFLNTWSELHRSSSSSVVSVSGELELSTPPPPVSFQRWFPARCEVPIRMPFAKLEHIVRRFDRTPVNECFFTFSAASVKRLKSRANAELAAAAMAGPPPPPTPTISSLQAVLAHLWRAVCRARRLPPEQETSYSVVIGCRGRIAGIPSASSYVGNAMVFGRASATAGELDANGLGFAAALLNRAVAEFDEDGVTAEAERWARGSPPEFTYMDGLSSAGTALVTGSSPRFDVFGNDFGWGPPVAVRSGSGNKADGKATVFQGPEKGGGSVSVEVCIAPDALRRLVADEEFMEAVTVPSPAVAVVTGG